MCHHWYFINETLFYGVNKISHQFSDRHVQRHDAYNYLIGYIVSWIIEILVFSYNQDLNKNFWKIEMFFMISKSIFSG